jgi:hypothetical protein
MGRTRRAVDRPPVVAQRKSIHGRHSGAIGTRVKAACESIDRLLRLRTAAKWIFRSLGLLVVVLVVAGILYQQIGRRRDLRGLARIGQSIDIGGRSLNLYCTGSGKPTVILESGSTIPDWRGYRFSPKSQSSHKHAGMTVPAMAGAIQAHSRGPPPPLPRTFMLF